MQTKDEHLCVRDRSDEAPRGYSAQHRSEAESRIARPRRGTPKYISLSLPVLLSGLDFMGLTSYDAKIRTLLNVIIPLEGNGELNEHYFHIPFEEVIEDSGECAAQMKGCLLHTTDSSRLAFCITWMTFFTTTGGRTGRVCEII